MLVGVPSRREKYSNIRSRPRADCAYSPTGPGGVFVFDPSGKYLGGILTGTPTANCGFGDDGSTLYITANDRLIRVRTKTKGIGF